MNLKGQECFFQDLTKNDIFHFIVNGLSGGDQKVDVTIKAPTRNYLHVKKQVTFDWYDNSNITDPGIHQI